MSRSNMASNFRRTLHRNAKRARAKALRVILYASIAALLKESHPGNGNLDDLLHQTLEEALRQLPDWLQGIAFGSEFHLHHRKAVLALIHKKVRCAAISEDLTQETFLRALQFVRSGKRLPPHRKAWLYTIARNAVNDLFRKQGRLKEVGWPDREPAEVVAATSRVVSEEAELAEHLGVLEHWAGKDLADLVRLRMDGLTNEEISKKHGVDERTVERWWQRLRDIVRGNGLFS